MSDDVDKKAETVDVASLFGNAVICNDAEPRDRDFYKWDEEGKRWRVLPCIDNLIVDTFIMGRGTPPSSRELTNVKIALGATQRIRSLASPCVIDWKTRTAMEVKDAIYASNGVLRLNLDGTVKVYPYGKAMFSLYRLPYAYDPQATCPTIDAWLADRLGNDPEQIEAYWELAGAALKPGNTWKTFWLFVGEGSTGKTSGLNLLRDIIGEENCSSLGAPYLNVGSVVTQIRGRLLNISEEKTGISTSCEETIKDISSGGNVNYNPKFRNAFSEPASAKLVFSMNRLPNFSDSSHAVYNRPVILSWSRPIALGEALTVDEIRRRLRTELPGALNRALAALHRLEQRGKVLRPKASLEITRALQKESSPVIAWFFERASYRQNGTCKVEDAFRDFSNWSIENRCKPIDRIQFGKQLRDIGSLPDGTVVKIRSKRGRDGKGTDGKEKFASFYEGLVLQPTAPEDEPVTI